MGSQRAGVVDTLPYIVRGLKIAGSNERKSLEIYACLVFSD